VRHAREQENTKVLNPRIMPQVLDAVNRVGAFLSMFYSGSQLRQNPGKLPPNGSKTSLR
jgi:hypothetical protein